MNSEPLRPVMPLERYRTLIAALASKHDTMDDTYWLRFAAQLVVLCPESPPELAYRIRAVAGELLHATEWYQTLASPARFVVAAMLIQHHIPVADFISEHTHATTLMSEVGLRHDRFYEIVAVLILMMTPGHRSSNLPEISRVKAIYEQMKGFHWWLTGPDDLPACVALAQCQGSAEELVARVEDAYQQLHAAGIPVGEHLQTAANLLPLTGLDMAQAVARYRHLSTTLQRYTPVLADYHYDPLALLTLLDHEPELVIERLMGVVGELDLVQPEGHGEANILIASDLTFLDLVRCDRHQVVLAKQPSLHAYHLASAVLISQVELNLVELGVINGVAQWPYP